MSFSARSMLDRAGLLNTSYGHLGAVCSGRRVLKAFCSSLKCSKSRAGSRNSRVVKNVPKSADNCPDCDHALFWQSVEVENEF